MHVTVIATTEAAGARVDGTHIRFDHIAAGSFAGFVYRVIVISLRSVVLNAVMFRAF